MEDEEDYEEDVEVMSVIEELKIFSPNAGNGYNPQYQTSKQRYLSGHN